MNCNDYNLKYLHIDIYNYPTDYRKRIDIPRPFDIITKILSGEVVFSDNQGNSVYAHEGDVVFIPMGTIYEMKWQGQTPSNFAIHYQFEKEQSKRPLQKIEVENVNFGSKPKSDLLAMSMFYRIYAQIESRIRNSKTSLYDNRIGVAVEFIRSNYNVDFTIEQLSDMCHLSPSRFHYLFKKSVGYTAIDYKNKVKTDIAMQMLISTTLSVEQISDKLNFNSSIYFRRVFKKFSGMSATQYRTMFFKQNI